MFDHENYICKNVYEESSNSWKQILEIKKHGIL